jgi:hypothetical protein
MQNHVRCIVHPSRGISACQGQFSGWPVPTCRSRVSTFSARPWSARRALQATLARTASTSRDAGCAAFTDLALGSGRADDAVTGSAFRPCGSGFAVWARCALRSRLAPFAPFACSARAADHARNAAVAALALRSGGSGYALRSNCARDARLANVSRETLFASLAALALRSDRTNAPGNPGPAVDPVAAIAAGRTRCTVLAVLAIAAVAHQREAVGNRAGDLTLMAAALLDNLSAEFRQGARRLRFQQSKRPRPFYLLLRQHLAERISESINERRIFA